MTDSEVIVSRAKHGSNVLTPPPEIPLWKLYLEKYQDRFAILGGICIQTVLGLVPQDELEREIRRVFSLLRGKRWVCCTTHFVQNHCSMEDLAFAYDLIYKLARE